MMQDAGPKDSFGDAIRDAEMLSGMQRCCPGCRDAVRDAETLSGMLVQSYESIFMMPDW